MDTTKLKAVFAKYWPHLLAVLMSMAAAYFGFKAPPVPPVPEQTLKAAVAPAQSLTGRRPLVNLVIRQKLAAHLVEGGMGRKEARKRAYDVLQDETIDAVAAEVLNPNDLAGGAVIDWIKLHWEDILAIVLKLLPLLLLDA